MCVEAGFCQIRSHMSLNNAFQSFTNSACEGYWPIISRLCFVALFENGDT